MDALDASWTAWMPLMAAHPLALAQLPSDAGLYKVRRAGGAQDVVWVAWEPRGVREVIERLSRQVHLPVEPYDDPSSPARLLWRLRRTDGVHFEVCGAALPVSEDQGRRTEREVREASGLPA